MEPPTSDKINLSQILTVCAVILGFSLTLITGQAQSHPYSQKLIYWLIIFPFGLEAILISFSNKFAKLRNLVDLSLIPCFIALFTALFLLFAINTFPYIKYIDLILQNISTIIGTVLFVLLLILLPILNVWFKKNMEDRKLKFYKSFYNLSKKIDFQRINFIVTVLGDAILKEEVIKKVLQTENKNKFFYDDAAFLNTDFLLKKENLILVVSRKINLIDCVKKIKEGENHILGVIAVGFKISTEESQQLHSYGIAWEECLNIGFE